jgi:hypothetical protein
MQPPFDIFRQEKDGNVLWLGLAGSLPEAEQRVADAMKDVSTSYLIVSQKSGKREVFCPQLTVDPAVRHQCLVYEGAPSKILPQLALVARARLADHYRCLYLNSPSMVAGMRSYLAAAGIDVLREADQGNLVLSSEQTLSDGRFDVDRMIQSLEEAVEQAVRDGYNGLWATGDMSWEFGAEREFDKLIAYETRLEQLFHRQPALCGVCQYHTETLSPEHLQQGLRLHPGIFLSGTLSRINLDYSSNHGVA